MSDPPPHCSTVEWKLFTSNLSTNCQIFVLSRWKKLWCLLYILSHGGLEGWRVVRVHALRVTEGGDWHANWNNFGNITSTMGFDSVPFRHCREWMFSDSFCVFDFEVGGPSHNISTCLKGAAATSVPRRDRPSRPPAAVSWPWRRNNALISWSDHPAHCWRPRCGNIATRLLLIFNETRHLLY